MPAARSANPSPVKQARASAYRALVLDAAERVFADQGYEGAKIKDVADAAGIALGTVYTLYPSKHDVFIAVHARRGGELIASVAEVLDASLAPTDALSRGLVAICRFYAAHPSYLRMHSVSGTSWAAPRLDVVEERVVYDAGRAPIVLLFERAAERGELGSEPPETSAKLVLASLQVFFAEWIAEDFATPADDVAARIERYLRRALLGGAIRE